MDTTIVAVFGQLLAAQAEVEAMKCDNKQRELNGCSEFNYSPNDFYSKADEIRSIKDQLFK